MQRYTMCLSMMLFILPGIAAAANGNSHRP